MDREMIINLSKKIIRIVLVAKLAGVCVKVGKAVYDCIPKYDTIDGIDTDVLIEQNTTDVEKIDLTTPTDLPEIPELP